MFCPECGGEYREGFTHCADCDADLVETLPEETPPSELVTVLEVSDPAGLALAESLLQDAGIPFFKRGEQLQNLFAMGTLGFGFDAVAGPVSIQVPEEHAEAAAQILARLAKVPEETEQPALHPRGGEEGRS